MFVCNYQCFVLIFILQDKIIDGHLFRQLPSYTMTVNRIPRLNKFVHESRILAGTLTHIRQYPYLVQIEVLSDGKIQSVCTGSILTPKIVLTAGHCIANKFRGIAVPNLVQDVYIRAGATIKKKGGLIIRASKKKVHPEYDTVFVIPINDVALLKLEKPLRFSMYIQPISLADENDRIDAHNWGKIAGWGRIKLNSSITNEHLHATDIPIIPLPKCKMYFENFSVKISAVNDNPIEVIFKQPITQDVFCSIQSNKGESCHGDSGGPFIINSKLYGITSWGRNCTDAVFTRVTDPNIRNWIFTTVTELLRDA